MKRQFFEVQVPFSGFYNSIHSSELDRVWESTCEYYAEETGDNMPEFLDSEYYSAIDWDSVHENYAKNYVESFLDWLQLDGKFSGMVSPRYYNYTTDRVFAEIDRDSVARLFSMASRKDLQETANKLFTSRDGFVSSYNPNVSSWGRVSGWDCNQLYALVLAAANNENCGFGSERFDSYGEYELVEDAYGNGEFDNWVWSSCDRAQRLSKLVYYMQERGKRTVRTMAQWHAARRAENRPFCKTPLGQCMA